VGATKVTPVDASVLGLGATQLGPATGASEVINVASIAGNELTLLTPLTAAHAVTDTVYGGLAGLSFNPQLVTDAGGELIVTIVHEMMHRASFGGLSDVGETDNAMYWTTGGTGASKLRFRDQTIVNTGTGVATGAKENQWNKVARPLIKLKTPSHLAQCLAENLSVLRVSWRVLWVIACISALTGVVGTAQVHAVQTDQPSSMHTQGNSNPGGHAILIQAIEKNREYLLDLCRRQGALEQLA